MVLKTKTVKLGRNDRCPCGSGLKYKKCCLGKEVPGSETISETIPETISETIKEMYLRKFNIRIKDKQDIEGIKKAGRLVLETLDLVEENIREGMTTDDINTLVHEFTIRNSAIPAPLNYRGFPKSACVSVNEVVCHGIPGNRVLKDGDIVNVDVTSMLDAYYADANKTFFVGTPGPDARRIVRVTKECLKIGMSIVRPGNTIGDIGGVIQEYAESYGCSVVKEFVGHGVGFEFHEQPQVPHFREKEKGIEIVPGMVFTIEPMINIGKRHLHILEDNWTAVTDDGLLSAQFEQTLLVTEEGFESLTPFDLETE